ncbi:MAG: 50S ribosomal protein L9 [bacterium]|jgi:large subunit ribosomal protein L9
MEVILREKFSKLGEEGDIVRVRDGYARNYLIPQGLAFPASSGNAAQIAHQKQMALAQRRKKIKDEQDLAKAIHELKVIIKAKAGEGDQLFGSVTAKQISSAIEQKGYVIDRRKIHLENPIRVLGEHRVPIKLSADANAEIVVEVVAE